jgi:hypothetical protein
VEENPEKYVNVRPRERHAMFDLHPLLKIGSISSIFSSMRSY